MKNEYRIVSDRFLGYEVQKRAWWHYPFWLQWPVNTHRSEQEARKYAHRLANKLDVIYLGKLP